MSAHGDNTDSRRALAWTGLTIAGVFAVVQACMPNGDRAIDTVIMFANGAAVALYGTILRAAGPRRGVIWSSILLGAMTCEA